MPIVEYEPMVSVWLQGIVPAVGWQEWMPERIDRLVFLIQLEPTVWSGTNLGIRVTVHWSGGQWVIGGFLHPSGHTCFAGVIPELENGFVDNQLEYNLYNFYSGQAWVIVEPIPNQVAELTGAITGPKSFYEPMPKATPHRSFRYARHYDGSRIYVRMKG